MTRLVTIAVLVVYVFRLSLAKGILHGHCAGACAPLCCLLIYPASCNGTSTVQVRTSVVSLNPSRRYELTLRPYATPDSLQLGHAKVVLDNSIASGTVTRDGGFLMCASVLQLRVK